MSRRAERNKNGPVFTPRLLWKHWAEELFPPSSGVDARGGNLGSGQRVSTGNGVAGACGATRLHLRDWISKK